MNDTEQNILKEKFILDACCGSRMFWLDKKQPNTIFCDIREYDKGFIDNRPNRELHPDMIMDFRDLKFPDKKFKLIIMDPPHLIGKPDGCRMTKTYGALNKETWQQDIKKGFDECWRCLDDYGVLVFKWNDSSVKRKELLSVLNRPYLFGHPNGSKIPTHWFVFMKIPEKIELEGYQLAQKENQSQQTSSREMVLMEDTASSGTKNKNLGTQVIRTAKSEKPLLSAQDTADTQLQKYKKETAEKVEKLFKEIDFYENNSDWNMPLLLRAKLVGIFKEKTE